MHAHPSKPSSSSHPMMGQSNLNKRPRRSSLAQHLQRILHVDGLGNRHGLGSQVLSDAPTPQQEQFTEQRTQEPRTYRDVDDKSPYALTKKHISYSYTSLGSRRKTSQGEHPENPAELSAHQISLCEPHTSSNPKETPDKSDICVSPTWNNISTQKKERRATLRLEAERLELEKRLMKLESTKDPSSLRRESRRLTKKQPFGSSSRGSSISADESRASKRFSSIFSSSRRSSRSRSSSLNEDDKAHPRHQPLGSGETSRPDRKSQPTTPSLSTTLPERFGTAISKELAVQSNPLIPNQLSPSLLHESQPKVGTTAVQGTGSRNISREDEHGQEPGRDEQSVAGEHISIGTPNPQASNPPAELDRLSFAATLNLEQRVSDKVQSSGSHTQLSSPQNATARAEDYREPGTINSSKSRQTSVTPSSTTHSRLRNSLTALQPGSSRRAPVRASPANMAQPRHKRFTSSPLAGFPTMHIQTDSFPDIVSAEQASACFFGTSRAEPSIVSEFGVPFDTNPPHSTSLLPLSNPNDRHDKQAPNSHLEVTGNPKGSLRARLLNGSKLSENSPRLNFSTAAPSPHPGKLSMSNQRSYQRVQHAAEPAKTQSSGSSSNALSCSSKHVSAGKGHTAKTTLKGKDTVPFRRNPDSGDQYMPPLPQRSPPNALNHGTEQSSASLSTSLSHDPESDEYNTADEAASSGSESYFAVKRPEVASASINFSTSSNKCPTSGSYNATQTMGSNVADLQSKKAAETPKQLQGDQLVAKLFVICCHCKFWHDMPSGVYAKLALPTNFSAISGIHPLAKKPKPNEQASYEMSVGDMPASSMESQITELASQKKASVSRTAQLSGTVVRCCWCEHHMSRMCCQGWTTIVHLRERHH